MNTYQVMPSLTDDEYGDLFADIEANGIRVPIDVDEDGNILDGHHRAKIADELGILRPLRILKGLSEAEKVAHAYAVNLQRRSLSREQRRALVQASLVREPELSDRQHAERAGVSPTTVGAVREQMEDSGELSKLDSRTGADGKTRPAKVTQTTKTETVIDAETGEILGTRAWAVAKFPVLDVAEAPDAEVVEVAKAVIAQPERDHDMRAEIGAKSLALNVRRANGELPTPSQREDMGKHYGRLLDDALMIQRNADAMAEWFASQPMEQRGIWSNSLRVLHRDLGDLLGRITEQPRLKVVQ